MSKGDGYTVKVTIGDATVEVQGAQAGVVKIVEALSVILRSPQRTTSPGGGVGTIQSMTPSPRESTVDLRSFFKEKAPSSDVEATAVVAYYYHYLAPMNERHNAIDSALLQDAFRLARWPLPSRTIYTLQNARNAGYLDSAGEGGSYRLNAVGYNLVEHTLGTSKPAEQAAPGRAKPKLKRKRSR